LKWNGREIRNGEFNSEKLPPSFDNHRLR
jgi:hypothetical protein